MENKQKVQLKKDFLKEDQKLMKNHINQQEKTNLIDLKSSNFDYDSFFKSCISNKMIIYNKFPNLNDIIEYYSSKNWNAGHPIYEYGNFNIEELAIVIQYLYSFFRNEEYKTVMLGYLERTKFHVLEGIFEQLRPNLYFLIGNSKTLEDYIPYKNCFLEKEQSFDFQKKIISFIGLRAKEGIIFNELSIHTELENHRIYPGIYYYDEIKQEYDNVKYLSHINIFDEYFYKKIRTYSGIEDTLNFAIHANDSFLAKILISIAIFKKNHQKTQLSNEDYQYIFYELFKDNSVNVKKEIERNIPKKLKLVSKNKNYENTLK